MGARTSEFFIWASDFFVVSSSDLRLRSRSIRSVSTAPRSRLASLLAFSYSTAGTLPDPTTFSSRCRLSSAAFSNSEEANGSAARLLQSSSSFLVSNCRQQLTFFNALADCATTGGERFRQLNETVILCSNSHHKGRFNPHGPIHRGDGRTPADRDHFRHRHQEIIRQREKEYECCSTTPQNSF